MEPDKIYKEYMTAGEDMADKVAAAQVLEYNIKSYKAKLSLDAKIKHSCSMAEADTRAVASDEYKEAYTVACEARRMADRARVRYAATQALFEARRTAEASERAAMRSAT